MNMRLLNFVVGAVVVTENGDGQFVGKQSTQPVEVFDEAGVQKALAEIRAFIDQQNQEGERDVVRDDSGVR
jgi:hypothetical protein